MNAAAEPRAARSGSTLLCVGELSLWHWAIVAVVVLLLFGSQRLPDAARGVGRSVRILRAELRGEPDRPGSTPTDPGGPES
jgi:sec-independent protein translocase protein TatA